MNGESVEDKTELNISGLRFTGLAYGPRDGTLVLCLHGFPQFADSYRPVLRMFGEAGYRAVAIDQRGYSSHVRPANVQDYELDLLVDDVKHFADALGTDRFHLVGHDWGGIVAWAFAARYPERLFTLSVLSTPHPDALKSSLRSDPHQMLKSSYIPLFRTPYLAERVIAAFNWTFLRRALRPYVSEAQIESIIQRMSEPRALTAALNWYRAVDLKSNAIGTITVPTLFIWGSKDQALGRKAALATAKFVSAKYTFEIFEGASHWLLDEEAPRVGESLVRRFASKLP